jgi:hypothetical protein
MHRTASKVARGVAAALLAVALGATGAPRPAQAVTPATIITVIETAKKIYDVWQFFQDGGKTIEEATAEIISAITTSQTAIIAHADALAAAPATACTKSAMIELASSESFTVDTTQRWAQDVTSCVTLIDSLHRTVADKAVADQLGFALSVVGPIALLARARAGYQPGQLVNFLIDTNTVLLDRLAPSCGVGTYTQLGLRSVRVTTCIQYTGAQSRTKCLQGAAHCTDPIFLRTAKLESSALTSWVALDAALIALTT